MGQIHLLSHCSLLECLYDLQIYLSRNVDIKHFLLKTNPFNLSEYHQRVDQGHRKNGHGLCAVHVIGPVPVTISTREADVESSALLLSMDASSSSISSVESVEVELLDASVVAAVVA